MSDIVQQSQPKKKFYPTWITLPGGQRLVVPDCQTHSAMMGEEYGEDAEPVSKKPQPPTLETVIAAGYRPEVAEKIVAEEQRKFAAGIKPYGDLEPEPMIPSGPGVVVQVPAEEEDLSGMFAKKGE